MFIIALFNSHYCAALLSAFTLLRFCISHFSPQTSEKSSQ